MADFEINIQVRECSECKHYLSGNKCRAFNVIPIEMFLDATTHNKPTSEQNGNYIFIENVEAPTMRVYAPGQ